MFSTELEDDGSRIRANGFGRWVEMSVREGTDHAIVHLTPTEARALAMSLIVFADAVETQAASR